MEIVCFACNPVISFVLTFFQSVDENSSFVNSEINTDEIVFFTKIFSKLDSVFFIVVKLKQGASVKKNPHNSSLLSSKTVSLSEPL